MLARPGQLLDSKIVIGSVFLSALRRQLQATRLAGGLRPSPCPILVGLAVLLTPLPTIRSLALYAKEPLHRLLILVPKYLQRRLQL